MADLTRDDVVHLASLAKLALSDDEIERFRGELSRILDYVAQLQAVDISGLEPTSQVTGLLNVERLDEVRSYGYDPKILLDNVPEVEDDQIKVRRVL
jgi:aspartyl-tRNA(Asn)/glutamyl-tRNA(Gln) amidotransferase subunit C